MTISLIRLVLTLVLLPTQYSNAQFTPHEITEFEHKLDALRSAEDMRTKTLYQAFTESINIFGFESEYTQSLLRRLITESDLIALASNISLADLTQDVYTQSGSDIMLTGTTLFTLWERYDQLVKDIPESNTVVYRNITPPGGDYPSGISPEDISEPEIRKKYEEMLRQNAINRLNLNRANQVKRAHRTFVEQAQTSILVLRHISTPEKMTQLTAIIRNAELEGSSAILEELERTDINTED